METLTLPLYTRLVWRLKTGKTLQVLTEELNDPSFIFAVKQVEAKDLNFINENSIYIVNE